MSHERGLIFGCLHVATNKGGRYFPAGLGQKGFGAAGMKVGPVHFKEKNPMPHPLTCHTPPLMHTEMPVHSAGLGVERSPG